MAENITSQLPDLIDNEATMFQLLAVSKSILGIVAILGNVAILYVQSTCITVRNHHYAVHGLAASDILIGIDAIMQFASTLYPMFSLTQRACALMVSPLVLALATGPSYTLLLSGLRLLAIVSPITFQRCKKKPILTLLHSFVLTLGVIAAAVVIYKSSAIKKVPVCMMWFAADEWLNNLNYGHVILTLSITYVNVLLYKKIKKVSQSHFSQQQAVPWHIDVSRAIITISTIYVGTMVLASVLYVISRLFLPMEYKALCAYAIGLLSLTNSCSNLFVYLGRSREYRQCLLPKRFAVFKTKVVPLDSNMNTKT